MSPLRFVSLIITVFALVAAIVFKLTTSLFEILRLLIGTIPAIAVVIMVVYIVMKMRNREEE